MEETERIMPDKVTVSDQGGHGSGHFSAGMKEVKTHAEQRLGGEHFRWQHSLKCPKVGLNVVCLGRSKQTHVARRWSQQKLHDSIDPKQQDEEV